MQYFLLIGKIGTLAFWILPVLALAGVFAPPWGYGILAAAFLLFAAHVVEFISVHGKLRAVGRDQTFDIVMVLLVGFFHWLPILRRSHPAPAEPA